MAGPYTNITLPVAGQPISVAGYGVPVRDAINDLDTRVATLETAQQYVLKRARRNTPYSTAITGSDVGILRLDDIPLKSGRVTQLTTSPITVTSTVANDIVGVRIRVLVQAAAGTPVTLATGAFLVRSQVVVTNTGAGVPPSIVLNAFYFNGSNGYMSAMVTAVRLAGTGNVTLPIGTTYELDLVAQDAGVDPGNTGVVL